MATDHGFGSASWWGFSPALDLVSVLGLQTSSSSNCDFTPTNNSGNTPDNQQVINILLLGTGDLRHILQTMANAHVKKINSRFQFFIIEGHLECFARHMLFLSLLSSDELGLREKSELFLELFGNSFIRSQTAHYLRESANSMIKMITDPDYLHSVLPILDISSLKYKERDMMEGIFKFWRNPDDKLFDIKQHWDGRLRQYLAQRYDSREGVFDWDYHMKLEELAPMIGSREYKKWRETGVAFRLRDDAPYENSNRTLASGVIIRHDGERIPRRGYFGDIVNSPYLTYGIHCENKEMLKRANEKFVKSCQQICEYNIQSLIQLLLKGGGEPLSSLHPAGPSRPPCATNGSLSVEGVIEEEEEESGDQGTHGKKGPLLDGSCKINFLPLTSAPEIGKKAKFHKFFHCVYFSNSMVHHLTSGIETTLADSAVLICETARYMLDLKKEHEQQYMDKVTGMANSLGFKIQKEPNPESAVAIFTR